MVMIVYVNFNIDVLYLIELSLPINKDNFPNYKEVGRNGYSWRIRTKSEGRWQSPRR